MVTVIGVRFRRAGKVYYFDPGEIAMTRGQHVIVETARGVEYGEVILGNRNEASFSFISPIETIAPAESLSSIITHRLSNFSPP